MNDGIKRCISLFFCSVFVVFSVSLVGTASIKRSRSEVFTQEILPEIQVFEQEPVFGKTQDEQVILPQHQEDEPVVQIEEMPTISQNTVSETTLSVLVHDTNTDKLFEIDFEEYVLGVLLSEMPTSFETEALKAQAVACRSYALYKSQEKHKNGAQLCTSPAHCQAFCSPESVSPERYQKAYDAVYGTKGEIMLFDGNPVLAVFHASSDRKTRSSQEVWGGSLAYLSSVDTAEAYNPSMDITKSYTFSKKDFADRLGISQETVSAVNIERTASGRVSLVTFPDKSISGKELVGLFSLRSQSFEIEVGENEVVITCGGYGHGVGMSQYGAQDMAQKGYGYKEILSHYYTGVTLGYM